MQANVDRRGKDQPLSNQDIEGMAHDRISDSASSDFGSTHLASDTIAKTESGKIDCKAIFSRPLF